jgi:glycosyltransferase involved in cell wall biosynthesis
VSERRGSARIRVLTLLDTLAAGGAERFAVELNCALDRGTFEPHIVLTKSGGLLEQRLRDVGVSYTVLARKRKASVDAAARLHRFARASDVIHSHLFGNNVWGALLARATGVPLVAHEHNRTVYTRFERLLDRHLIGPSATRILCVSATAAAPVLAGGADPGRVEIVPNGVPEIEPLPREAARMELRLPDDSVVVGSIASLRPEKGHDVLLGAFARLVRERPDMPLLLCLVGDGNARDGLIDLAHRLAIGDRVVLAGQRGDAPRLAQAFDVAVLASRTEGMPLAALETLAAGVPLVATSVGALPEILAGGAGVLVETGDAAALAKAIAGVLDEPIRAAELSAAGRRRFAERYRLEPVARRIEEIYLEILGAARSAEPPPAAFTGDPSAEQHLVMSAPHQP